MSRLLRFENLINTRDLGGMKTKDGRRVKPGKLIRSGQLFVSSEADREQLKTMVTTIADFRTDQEMYEKPDPYMAGVDYHHIPIFNNWMAGVTWEEKPDISDDELFAKLQSDEDLSFEYMKNIYRGFVSNDFYIAQYRKFVDLLLQDRKGAILWHCTVGKDRAGFASILTEELLGICREDIIADYMQTKEHVTEEAEALAEHLKRKFPEPGAISDQALFYMFNVDPAFIEATYAKIELLYGSFERFMEDALKVTKTELERIRGLYLE